MSIVAQFAPYKLKAGDWKGKRDALGDAVVDDDRRLRART